MELTHAGADGGLGEATGQGHLHGLAPVRIISTGMFTADPDAMKMIRPARAFMRGR
jgi:hypothetical protein